MFNTCQFLHWEPAAAGLAPRATLRLPGGYVLVCHDNRGREPKPWEAADAAAIWLEFFTVNSRTAPPVYSVACSDESALNREVAEFVAAHGPQAIRTPRVRKAKASPALSVEEFQTLPREGYLRRSEVCGLLSIAPSTLYKWTQTGRFPAPEYPLGTRRPLWHVRVIRPLLGLDD